MTKTNRNRIAYLAAIAAVAGTQFNGTLAHAALTDEQEKALIEKVNELEQQVKILQRQRDVDQENAGEKAKAQPTVSLGMNGLNVRTTDSNFVMYIHGFVQADARFYEGQKGSGTSDTFLFRRVRPTFEGTLWQDIGYNLKLELGNKSVSGTSANNQGILDDCYMNARYLKEAQIQVGKFKPPVGLERLISNSEMPFIENGLATELVPNKDLGVAIHNDYFNERLGYSVGVWTGTQDNVNQDSDTDSDKDYEGRLFLQPFLNHKDSLVQHLGFGVGGSIGKHEAGTTPAYVTPGQQTFFSYSANAALAGLTYRADPQLYWYYGPFCLTTEYVLSSVKLRTLSPVAGVPSSTRLNNTAWQVTASYFLTGEENTIKFNSLAKTVPSKRFGLTEGSGWGALELVSRLERLSLDNNVFSYPIQDAKKNLSYAAANSAQEATGWLVGVNWYLNSNLKVNLDYEQTTFTRGYTAAAGQTAHQPEHVILSQVQFQF
jgi:phosphate-selective porin OprO/OprP